VILISWLVALPEYYLAVPAIYHGNRVHGGAFSTAQLKVMQEGIALLVFLAFSLLVLREMPRWLEFAGMVLIMIGLAVALSGRSG